MSEKTNDIPVTQDQKNEDIIEKMDTENEHDEIKKSLNEKQDVPSDIITNKSCTADAGTTKEPTSQLNEPVNHSDTVNEKKNDNNINDSDNSEKLKEENKILHIGNGESCKRKLDDSDDQATKISRTFSTNDAFSDDRNKMTTSNDTSISNSTKNSLQINTSEALKNELVEEKNLKSDSIEDLNNGEIKNSDTNDTKLVVNENINNEDCTFTNDKNENKTNDIINESLDIPTKKIESRNSLEILYDKLNEPPKKPKELVEIDEDGEKIILDSSQENSMINMKNGDDSFKLSDSKNNQITEGYVTNGNNDVKTSINNKSPVHSIDTTKNLIQQKLPEVLNLVSDSEGESFIVEDVNSTDKSTPITKEINFNVKLKIIYHVDKLTKDFVNKEIVTVNCTTNQLSHSDSFSRDISTSEKEPDTSPKSDSPKSVKSLYTLPKCPRVSLISTVSSSSSSSAESNKNGNKNNKNDKNEFCLPQGVPKQSKKIVDESNEKSKKDWKNVNLLTSTILQFVDAEIFSYYIESEQNESIEQGKLSTSTPEVVKNSKSSINEKSKNIKKNKITKKSKNLTKKNSMAITDESKVETPTNEKSPTIEKSPTSNSSLPSRQLPSTPTRRCTTLLRNNTPRSINDVKDDLIGQLCYAKWTHDNIYYPAKVVKRSKDNFLDIKFLDGQSKIINENLVIPIPKNLVNLEIHYRTQNDRYSYVAVIKSVCNNNNSKVKYLDLVVETEDHKKETVNLKDTFMSSKQIKMLQNSENNIVPLTSQINKQSNDSTPKSNGNKTITENLSKVLLSEVQPSSSSSKIKDKNEVNHMVKCLRNYAVEKSGFNGVQEEITDMPNDISIKGPVNRMKGKAKNNKKKDDQEIIKKLGPIPPSGSKIFSGTCFMIVCVSVQTIDRYADENSTVIDSHSEPETDNELEWTRKPLLRDRLTEQIKAGGGIVYEKFSDIPESSYINTKLVTNVPNVSLNSLLCMSVGIRAYNHTWIIHSCQENKLITPSSYELPAGWSLQAKAYTEFCNRPSAKPFTHAIAAIAQTEKNNFFLQFWSKIIQNLGGGIRIVKHAQERFEEATFVLTDEYCPDWLKFNAHAFGSPLVSSKWIMQCLIEGRVVDHEEQLVYKHDYVKP